MEKNEDTYAKFLVEALGTEITYEEKIRSSIKPPYRLTVKGFRYLYLNNEYVRELTPKEQIILIASTEGDPTQTPENTVAAICQAKRIRNHTKSKKDAIYLANTLLIEQNKAFCKTSAEEHDKITDLAQLVSQLEYYQKILDDTEKYEQDQQLKLSAIINFKERIKNLFKRKKFTPAPHPQKKVDYGKKLWEKVRKEKNIPDNITNQEAIELLKYGHPKNELFITPFEYVRNNDLLEMLQEQYNISNIALQILDGSAYKLAKDKIRNKNFFPYFNYLNKNNPTDISKLNNSAQNAQIKQNDSPTQEQR